VGDFNGSAEGLAVGESLGPAVGNDDGGADGISLGCVEALGVTPENLPGSDKTEWFVGD
jgi:hypothetical protein